MSAKPQQDSIWSGVYDRFDQVPQGTRLFDTELWSDKQKERLAASLSALSSQDTIPELARSRDYPLATFMAAALQYQDTLRLVDCGGGLGQTFIDAIAKIPAAKERISCIIVETPAVLAAVPDSLADLPVTFAPDIDSIQGGADILHLGSTLHYIEDWRGFFTSAIARLSPRTIVLSDLLVGDIPSFVTAQGYGDRIVPVQCINIGEFLTFWGRTDYELSYRSHYYPLPGEEYFPRQALPETHRIKTASHLVFSRKKRA